jgi:hypothetical protein
MSPEEPLIGKTKGLAKSLRASAMGVRQPIRKGLLGPLRTIIYARTLRSNKVKKATATSSKRVEKNVAINVDDLNSMPYGYGYEIT